MDKGEAGAVAEVIWIIWGPSGPIQAYRDRHEAEEFALSMGATARVNCVGLMSPAESGSADA